MNPFERHRWLAPSVLLVAGGLLLSAGFLVFRFSNNDAPAQTTAVTGTEDIPRVSLDDARSAYEQGSAVFVDVRSASSFAAVSIPGSLSIPFSELDTRFAELDSDDWIITICA